jgi:hypothetical protein
MIKMKKKLINCLASLMLILSLTACNSVTRNLGGTMTVELDQGKKLVNCTWKEDEFWYLIRDMKEDEKADTYEFIEKSNMGVLEGKVVIIEKK